MLSKEFITFDGDGVRVRGGRGGAFSCGWGCDCDVCAACEEKGSGVLPLDGEGVRERGGRGGALAGAWDWCVW